MIKVRQALTKALALVEYNNPFVKVIIFYLKQKIKEECNNAGFSHGKY